MQALANGVIPDHLLSIQNQSWICYFFQLKESDESSSKWSVLRDDFMMGATMKDWDKDESKDDGDNDNENHDIT